MSITTDHRDGDVALRAASAALRLYMRHAPWAVGKSWIWNRLIRPYIAWRPLRITAETRFGARIDGAFPDLVHAYVYFFGVWEPAITALYRAALKPGDIVIDIGANVGVHTLLASRLVGPTGRVHAIEASPWIFARLRGNLDANAADNVLAYNMAATDIAGRVPVFLHDPSNLGGTTILASEAAKAGAQPEATVTGAPLTGIVPMADILAARLIKIDVEGAEWLVLQGMREVLPLLSPDVEILVEINAAALAGLGASLDALLALFAEAGFAAFEVANEYRPEFYTRTPPLTPLALTRRDVTMADLVFRRAPVV